MRKKRLGRKTIKWICTFICGFFLLMFILSPWWQVIFSYADKYGEPASWAYSANFVGGKLELVYLVTWGAPIDNPEFIKINRWHGPTGWWFHRSAASKATSRFSAVYIPIWFLFLLTAIPTFFLWRSDRDYPKGHCQTCGYNLKGNTTGTCPECGTELEGRE